MPLTPPPSGKAAGWRGALKELRIDTKQQVDDDDELELTPDSMSARVAEADSPVGKRRSIPAPIPPVRQMTIEDGDFGGSMHRRVSGVGA